MVIYVDSDTFVAYALQRGITVDAITASYEIRKAQDYIDFAYSFKGTPVNSDSAFPRYGLADFDATTVPVQVKAATMQLALMSLDGVSFHAGTVNRPVKREVVASGKIETEYDTTGDNANSTQDMVRFSFITKMLSDIDVIEDGVGVFNMRGLRG